jgi:hypothetical protein
VTRRVERHDSVAAVDQRRHEGGELAPRPAQPCMRSTAGPSPHVCPITEWPSTSSANGAPGAGPTVRGPVRSPTDGTSLLNRTVCYGPRGEQGLNGTPRSGLRPPIAEQSDRVVAGEDHAVEIVRELFRIGVGAKAPLGMPVRKIVAIMSTTFV